jgi:ribosomal protein S18 acetylase RimI-like enzyme
MTSTLIKRFAIITNNNKEIVARLDCTIQGTTVRLETLYVSPESRGRNFGSWLVGKLMLSTKEEFSQIKLFETNTDQYNDNALKILKKYNFYVKYTIDELIKNRQ